MDWLLKLIHIIVEKFTFLPCFIDVMREKKVGAVPLEEKFKKEFGKSLVIHG